MAYNRHSIVFGGFELMSVLSISPHTKHLCYSTTHKHVYYKTTSLQRPVSQSPHLCYKTTSLQRPVPQSPHSVPNLTPVSLHRLQTGPSLCPSPWFIPVKDHSSLIYPSQHPHTIHTPLTQIASSHLTAHLQHARNDINSLKRAKCAPVIIYRPQSPTAVNMQP